jgi:hypothetical protein
MNGKSANANVAMYALHILHIYLIFQNLESKTTSYKKAYFKVNK